ncbi:pyridine nucleotide-disulfide oxidoreductase domain-containing protein [Striga asiatica]|uniref:Pyridine nucleotide-disulfide oxidoreductase domain-containing protein n=1 Tax=Striga asiatica TaxID=4170 RepID=A0A5A7R364_STRAF|nr:pyridine nucleotide-disulfide oxidoreductase domain-containing protein [Striga asiatica]
MNMLYGGETRELELARHGLKLLKRSPSSFTPCLDGRYLLLGSDKELNYSEISKFSKHDAEAYPRYENLLEKFCGFMDPLLDSSPPEKLQEGSPFNARMKDNLQKSIFWAHLLRRAASMGQNDLLEFVNLLLSPASKVLNNWFEADVLKATLATDAVIGTTGSINTPGGGYVLLHHMMGETDGERGIWSYVEGGMGSVSLAISNAAREAGAAIITEAEVSKLMIEDSGRVSGVLLADGTKVCSSVVLSNATPYKTFVDFVPHDVLPDGFLGAIKNSDYSSATTKINLAVDKLPQFHCCKLNGSGAGPQHMGTIHIGCERCFDLIEEYAPGFNSSIIGYDMLTPPDLEKEFGLTGGNIFHGAMRLDSLFLLRPVNGWSNYRTPLKGLYLCGSGAHPGGGVMGAPGRNAARVVMQDVSESTG